MGMQHKELLKMVRRIMSYPHGDEEQEQAELLVAVLQGVAQALQAGRVAGQLKQVFLLLCLKGAQAFNTNQTQKLGQKIQKVFNWGLIFTFFIGEIYFLLRRNKKLFWIALGSP